MADPRATARQWLAGILHGQMCDGEDHTGNPFPRCGYAADAILSTPGVTVSSLTGPAEHWGPAGSLCIGPDLETRTAIMLPAEEGTRT